MAPEVKQALEEIRNMTLLSVKQFFTVEEFCLLTSLSKETVYRLMRNHVISYTQPLDSKRYISRKEYESFMEQGHVSSIAELIQER